MKTPRLVCLVAAFLGGMIAPVSAAPIDRQALVTRHNPTLQSADRSSPFMVGNGELAFTADITGLQTFPELYSPLVPLITQAQWGWHSFPNEGGFAIEQAEISIGLRGVKGKYPWIRDREEAKQPHVKWLRENPHKISLGRLGLWLMSAQGKPAAFVDLSETRQTLDLWNGRLLSGFRFDGAPVEVETSIHPTRDVLIVRLTSPLLSLGRLGVDVKFPGVSAQINPDPADWSRPGSHATAEISRGQNGLVLQRELDETRYFVRLASDRKLAITAPAPHAYRVVAPGSTQLTLLVEFTRTAAAVPLPDPESARADVARGWQSYWKAGAAIDFSGSTDPRAQELERRVVLSQYLTAVNSAGSLPPQEEGLFSNSWFGKFHLEMHAWHAAHFAVWGRPELLERSMPFYARQLPEAKARARSHGARGAWWPKMVGPEGRESPSTINPFIMWQQPHPIYLAEALYGATPERATLEKYQALVFETADLLASWPTFDAKRGRYVLGPPVIPAQENFAPLTTFNPTFELEYWRFGLATAQAWRERLGMKRNPRWDQVLEKLSPLPRKDGLYLAAESQPDLWERARSAECSNHAAEHCPNRDHPSFVAALGYLPGTAADRDSMRRTLDAVMNDWDLRQTWGWDWPMLAMTAARLGDGDRAVGFLLSDARNFQFGVSGMTPRVHVDANGTDETYGAGYRRAAETYFPSNGSLLLAVALMVEKKAFPTQGWNVHSEGFKPVP